MGDVRVNRKELTMSFAASGKKVTIKGEPGINKVESSLQSLVCDLHGVSEGFLVEFNNLISLEGPTLQVHPALDNLLVDFNDIL